MNTPRSKALIRSNSPRPPKTTKVAHLDGSYVGSLHNDELLSLLGKIVTYFPQIEERMIDVMALLMGDRSAPARQVFRSVISEEARIKIMLALLEHSPVNRDKGQEFDEIISIFSEVRKKRNAYVHGLWQTHSSGRCFLQETSPDPFAEFISSREVTATEMRATLSRMGDLWSKCLAVTYPHFFWCGSEGEAASLEKYTSPSATLGFLVLPSYAKRPR